MNTLERHIYNLVRFSPKLKKSIVKVYQYLLSIIPQKRVKSDFQIMNREGYFFGFHDKSPWSPDNKYLLAHKTSFDLKMPNGDDEVEIGVFKGEKFDEFVRLSTTKTWNWQMGSMLQWIGDTNYIIFNDYNEEKHYARTIDISGVSTNVATDFAPIESNQRGLNDSDMESNIFLENKSFINLTYPF